MWYSTIVSHAYASVKVIEFVSDTVKDGKGVGPGCFETNLYVKLRILCKLNI
jgi:hypothetical protein